MGTRGLMAFTFEGETKAMYNHWDSYPSGLGKELAKWIKDMDLGEARAQFASLRKVDPDVSPTEGQQMLLKDYADLGVSTRSLDDWYVLLRETQGNPGLTLRAGYYMDGFDIGGQEWGYNIDLSNRVLEIYDTCFRGGTGNLGDEYRLVRTFTFDSLRNDEVDFDALEDILDRENNPEDYED